MLILIDVQYSQNAIFSFEKGSNSQNHSSSGSQDTVKKSPPQQNFRFPAPKPEGGFTPAPLTTIWKTQHYFHIVYIFLGHSVISIATSSLFNLPIK